MLAILQFVLSDFWTFLGAAILLLITTIGVSTVLDGAGRYACAALLAVIGRR